MNVLRRQHARSSGSLFSIVMHTKLHRYPTLNIKTIREARAYTKSSEWKKKKIRRKVVREGTKRGKMFSFPSSSGTLRVYVPNEARRERKREKEKGKKEDGEGGREREREKEKNIGFCGR